MNPREHGIGITHTPTGWRYHVPREIQAAMGLSAPLPITGSNSPYAVTKTGASAPGIPDRSLHGDVGALAQQQLVDYFVQLHDAARAGRHHDLRLGTPESGLLSWALRKGLPPPGGKHLAVRQPLHEHTYGAFQGEIPKGEYGAGKVTTHDIGKALVTKVGPGEVQFTVAHRKTPERYVLKQTSGQHWLLINTTPTRPVGHTKLHYTQIPAARAEEVLRQLAPGSSVQAKIDGAASLTHLVRDKAEVLSYRPSVAGTPIVHSERLMRGRPALNLPGRLSDTILRGELYGVRGGKAIEPQELGGLLNATVSNSLRAQKDKDVALRNVLFDVERWAGRDVDKSQTPYSERLAMVHEALRHLPASHFHAPEEARTPEEALALWQRVASGQHPLTREGVVVHPPSGKPSKIKLREEQDVHVADIFPGRGKYQGRGAGGFRYRLQPGGPVIGEVGTGLSDALREEMHQDPEAFRGRLARVISQGRFPSGALRAPALLALHEDVHPGISTTKEAAGVSAGADQTIHLLGYRLVP